MSFPLVEIFLRISCCCIKNKAHFQITFKYLHQRILTYVLKVSLTTQLTSCLTSLDSTKQENVFLFQQGVRAAESKK